MAMYSKILTCFLVAVLVSGCTGKPAKPRSLEINTSAIVVNNVDGGVVVRVENAVTGIYTDVSLTTAPFTVLVADGKWNFYLVGFFGPGEWGGTTECGGALDLELGPNTTDIDILVSNENCANSPYSTLISDKVSKWDSATWDTSTWGL